MAGDNETVEDIVREMRTEYARNYFCENSRRRDGEYCDNEFVAITPSDIADRIEAAWKHERDELKNMLARRSSHLNAIFQKAFELGNAIPVELRKVMDDCIVAEDKAVGFGVFSDCVKKEQEQFPYPEHIDKIFSSTNHIN